MTPTPGTIVAAKYRVERVLGEGGMGCVVAARHVDLGQRVALKFLHAELSTNPEIVARFLREGQAAAQLQSEHVARVTDVDRLADGTPYLVLEYLEGDDLSRVVRDRGPLSMTDAVDYVLQACEAIAEAHALGIVHRDLKPANIFLVHRRDGATFAKVLDFGISKITAPDARAQSLTRTHGVMGSPLYMSPEQLRSARDVDARTDIWALGVTLFELLTGTQPFVADDVPSLTLRIALEPPRSLRSLRPDLPVELEFVLTRCFEKDPERRYANVGEFARAIAAFGPGPRGGSVDRIARLSGTLPMPAPSVIATPIAIPGGGTTSPTSATVAVTARGHRTSFVVGAFFVALLLGGTGAWFAFGRTQSSQGLRPDVEPSSSDAKSVSAMPSPSLTQAAEPPPPAPTVILDASTIPPPVKLQLPVKPAKPFGGPSLSAPAGPTSSPPPASSPSTSSTGGFKKEYD